MKTNLTSHAWWRAALLRAIYTTVAIAVPYLGGALLSDILWWTALSAAALGFLASVLTSLAGLPEAEGIDLPWWLAAVERVIKTFAQALAAGFVGATLLADVAWSTVIQAAIIAALTSLLRLILATLPADPTLQPLATATIEKIRRIEGLPVAERSSIRTALVESVQATVSGVDVEQVTDLSADRRYPLN